MIPINKFLDNIGSTFEDEHGILYDSLYVKALECAIEVEEDDIMKEVTMIYTIKIMGSKEK